MNVYYVGSGSGRLSVLKQLETSFIALGWDKWDDYSYKTYLPVYFVVDHAEIEIPNIRILLENSRFTAETLDRLLQAGWDGRFPIPGTNYISLPNDITFYQIIAAKLGEQAALDAVRLLRDASYFHHLLADPSILPLIDSDGFRDSLLREGGSNKAYADGWRIFSHESSTIHDFQINVPTEDAQFLPVRFRFNSNVLPYDINVLIGPNGIGKSHCLQLLVEYWLKIGRGELDAPRLADVPHFDQHPNIGKLILISYSPFEEFTLDLSETNLQDRDAYQYFGFRRRMDADGGQRIGISRNLPASDSAKSIIRCLTEDRQFGFLPRWVNKFETAKDVLAEAIQFDDLALALNDGVTPEQILPVMTPQTQVDAMFFRHGDREFLKLGREISALVDLNNLEHLVDFAHGVVFARGNLPVNLSSGQRLFSYIVINVLGALKNNSLVVVDEPELFLHPNLEITFISLLKSVLGRFNSKAILATHSLVTVREVPANCVHVFRRVDFGKEVLRPPFETFGGDIQRISSYVFGDRAVAKPYQNWIAEKLHTFSSPDEFIHALGDEISEELLMRIRKIAKES